MNSSIRGIPNEGIIDYYSKKFKQFGATAQGVDWNGEQSQRLRFETLWGASGFTASEPVRILDYGCGYGGLADYLSSLDFKGEYLGFDIVESYIQYAQEKYLPSGKFAFTSNLDVKKNFDVCFASGVFNVQVGTRDEWVRNQNPTRPSSDLFFPEIHEIAQIVDELKCQYEVFKDYGLWEWTMRIDRGLAL